MSGFAQPPQKFARSKKNKKSKPIRSFHIYSQNGPFWSEWVEMVRKSKDSKKAQTIPKLDCTSKEQCLAISKQFQCSPNFSTRSDRWLFLTVLMGTMVILKIRKTFLSL